MSKIAQIKKDEILYKKAFVQLAWKNMKKVFQCKLNGKRRMAESFAVMRSFLQTEHPVLLLFTNVVADFKIYFFLLDLFSMKKDFLLLRQNR